MRIGIAYAHIFSRSSDGRDLKQGSSGVVGEIISMFLSCRETDVGSMILIWRPWICGVARGRRKKNYLVEIKAMYSLSTNIQVSSL
jgi:hypothetical protein